MFEALTFWQGFLLGLLIGFLVGLGAMILIRKKHYRGEDVLAWCIGVSWVVWHLVAGFTGIIEVPPSMYDIVSGGAIGFIFGEKFFDYIASSVGKVVGKK